MFKFKRIRQPSSVTEQDKENDLKCALNEDVNEPKTISSKALDLLKSENALKSGYLLKKGEKGRTWKKRWFVLRPAKLAIYKDNKEYKLLQLIDLDEIHKVVQVTTYSKYAFALVTPKQALFVQASNTSEMKDWMARINQAKQILFALDDTSSVNRDQLFAQDVISNYKSNHDANAIQLKSENLTSMSIPGKSNRLEHPTRLSVTFSENYYPPSPTSDPMVISQLMEGMINSDEEEYTTDKANLELEESRNRVLIEGYLLKLGRNRGWKKRWFVLRTDTLAYYEDEKIIDSLEIEPVSKSRQHCFKILIPKRSYVISAQSENIMEAWLDALAVATRRAKIDSRDGSSCCLSSEISCSP
ncbi:hypothetical protein G6F56_009393 [Rhizopus delemar]|nr:hypothetical protein G6F56_009393 [Rhizopus delemar]